MSEAAWGGAPPIIMIYGLGMSRGSALYKGPRMASSPSQLLVSNTKRNFEGSIIPTCGFRLKRQVAAFHIKLKPKVGAAKPPQLVVLP